MKSVKTLYSGIAARESVAQNIKALEQQTITPIMQSGMQIQSKIFGENTAMSQASVETLVHPDEYVQHLQLETAHTSQNILNYHHHIIQKNEKYQFNRCTADTTD